jgi:hypothetical protein
MDELDNDGSDFADAFYERYDNFGQNRYIKKI